VQLPSHIAKTDQQFILSQIKTAKSKEEKAKEIAWCCQDSCLESSAEVYQKESEKRQLQWRNQIFEGQSRGGKMLKSALILGTK